MTEQATLTTAVQLAQQAGRVLMSCFGKPLRIKEKSASDVVTDADYRAEATLISGIQQNFPGHRIVSEESGAMESSSEYTWYIDPLDGTKNFARGYPMFCVSLGLAQNDRMIAGVVHDPIRGETFTSYQAGGAWLNDTPISVSKTSKMSGAVLSTGYPSATRHRAGNPNLLFNSAMATQGIRRSGSSALDLAYIAAGRLDGMWEVGLSSWDIAAGILLIAEAGGTCTDLAGDPLHPGSPHLLVTNGLLHAPLLNFFKHAAFQAG